jgi:hypothetical protein
MSAWIKSAWLSMRSNTLFVAFEGGATGAALNYLYDAVTSGHPDFSRAGWQKLGIAALTGGVTAIRLLYRPAPPSSKSE